MFCWENWKRQNSVFFICAERTGLILARTSTITAEEVSTFSHLLFHITSLCDSMWQLYQWVRAIKSHIKSNRSNYKPESSSIHWPNQFDTPEEQILVFISVSCMGHSRGVQSRLQVINDQMSVLFLYLLNCCNVTFSVWAATAVC